MVKEEVEISHRVHSMIIGRRGAGIRKIMSDYKVDIKLPRQGDANPDLVVVSRLVKSWPRGNLATVDVMIIIFGDFCQFSAKKLAFSQNPML
jgi:hypothetical protein